MFRTMKLQESVLTSLIACLLVCCTGDRSTALVIDRFSSSRVGMPLEEMVPVVADSAWRQKAKYVCMVYEDSLSCTYCFVSKQTPWQQFEEKVGRDDFSVCFVIPGTAGDRETLERVYYYSPYTPPTYIDTSGVFLRDNPMVDSSRVLRSFLMDASGRVLVVGNPTANDGVARSMIEVMTEESDQVKEQGRREDGDDA